MIFVRQGLSFSKLSTSISLLDPFSYYAGVNMSPSNSSSLSFLKVYVSSIRSSPTDSRTDFFSPSILPSCKNLFIMGTSTAITLSRTQKLFPIPVGRRYSIGSFPLTSFSSMTDLLFSIAPLAVASPLTFPLLPSLSPSLAPEKCFKTWV